MKTEIGNYTLDCDFDPTIQDNSTEKRFPIDDIGFVYNCVFKQKAAFVHSVERIREVYPESKIYAVSDGGLDYSFLEDENFNLYVLEINTVPGMTSHSCVPKSGGFDGLSYDNVVKKIIDASSL